MRAKAIRCDDRKDCGLLRLSEARKWKHWWTVRGHLASYESTSKPGIVHCWLTLEKEMKPGLAVNPQLYDVSRET